MVSYSKNTRNHFFASQYIYFSLAMNKVISNWNVNNEHGCIPVLFLNSLSMALGEILVWNSKTRQTAINCVNPIEEICLPVKDGKKSDVKWSSNKKCKHVAQCLCQWTFTHTFWNFFGKLTISSGLSKQYATGAEMWSALSVTSVKILLW